ncbi:MAG: hypothetical protein WCH46_08675, partial [bacterium]
MRRYSLFIAAVVMLTAFAANVSAQTGRVLGARRVQLDDGTGAASGLTWLSDVGGSLGVDLNGNSGIVNGFQFPSPCALLDLNSTAKGFLVPRMSGPPTIGGGQELAICGGAPTEGLMVYNTTSHTLDIFNGSAWGAISGWNLRGNSLPNNNGIAAGGNYLGTNNAFDLVIATNAVEQMRVDATGRVGIDISGGGTISPTWALTVGAVGGQSTLNTGAERVNGLFTNIGGANINQSSGNTTNINNLVAGAVNIGFTGGTTTIATGGLGNLVMTGIAADASPSQWLTLNGANQVRVTPLANIAEQGVSYQLEGGNQRFRLGGNVAGTGVGSVPFTTDRFINTNANAEHITMGAGGVDFATFNGGTGGIGLNNGAANAGATSIGNTTLGGQVMIASNTAGNGPAGGAVTIDVANSATNNLVLNNIAADVVPTQWLSIQAGTNNVRSTLASGTALEGVVFTTGAYRLGSIVAGTGAGSNPFLANRHVNLNTFILDFTVGNNTSQLLTLNANANTVTVNSTNNTVTSTGAAGNNLNATNAAGQNTLTGQAGNTLTATTGNNTLGAAAVNAL